jgi:hypothetical protein
MSELERALVALGRELKLPSAPDLVPGIRARLERRTRTRRALVLAFAAAVLAIGIAFAVPPARTAILRFFDIGSVRIERVNTLPAARHRPLTAGLGKPHTRPAAQRIAGFRMKLPHFKGAPPTRFYARPGLISTTIRSGPTTLLLSELEGDQLAIGKKFVPGATAVEPVRVGRYSGLFVSGGPHVIAFVGPSGYTDVHPRLAGNTLIWVAAARTYRLEGKLSTAEAIGLARLITP